MEKKIKSILLDTSINKKEKLNFIGSLRDGFEYKYFSEDDAKNISNQLVEILVNIDNEDLQEEILNALLEGENNYCISKNLNIDPIVKNIPKFNNNCKSYIFSLMGNSGNKSYMPVLKLYQNNPLLADDIEDALEELNYRIL